MISLYKVVPQAQFITTYITNYIFPREPMTSELIMTFMSGVYSSKIFVELNNIFSI